MTEITIYQKQNKDYEGFLCSGHAGSSEYGKDIVCASISVLVINTINSIESFTSTAFICDADEESGEIELHFTDDLSQDASLLMDSMILGLKGIQDNYGNEFIILNFKEV